MPLMEVNILVYIRNNKTMEVREHRDTAWWDIDNDMPNLFIWEEGNFSCDCNRYLFFQRAKGENEDNPKCGDDAYSVNIINPKNGNIIYQEY